MHKTDKSNERERETKSDVVLLGSKVNTHKHEEGRRKK